MSDPVKVVVVALVVAAAFTLMWRGWRARAARSAALVPQLPRVPDGPTLGRPRLGPVAVTYLATADAADRLARVAVHRLAVRAPATVAVHDAGVLVARVGAADIFVPAADLLAVSRASGMAGTAVGTDRVVVLRWRLGAATLDTGLLPRRADDCAPLAAAAGGLVAGAHTDRSAG